MKRTSNRSAKTNYSRSTDIVVQPMKLTDTKYLGKGVKGVGTAATWRGYADTPAYWC